MDMNAIETAEIVGCVEESPCLSYDGQNGDGTTVRDRVSWAVVRTAEVGHTFRLGCSGDLYDYGVDHTVVAQTKRATVMLERNYSSVPGRDNNEESFQLRAYMHA